jgi:hypothetical protein
MVNRIPIGVIATIVILAMIGVLGCGEETEQSAQGPIPTETPSPAYILASLDAEQLLDRSDSRIPEYEAALAATAQKCTNEPSLIGDFAHRGVEILAEEGVVVSRLEMLNAIADSVPEGLRLDCAEVAAVIVTLMGSE